MPVFIPQTAACLTNHSDGTRPMAVHEMWQHVYNGRGFGGVNGEMWSGSGHSHHVICQYATCTARERRFQKWWASTPCGRLFTRMACWHAAGKLDITICPSQIMPGLILMCSGIWTAVDVLEYLEMWGCVMGGCCKLGRCWGEGGKGRTFLLRFKIV